MKYFDNNTKDYKIYGISQNPDTSDYALIFENDHFIYCEECCKEYTEMFAKWCKPCQINYLEKNFKNWTSKNKQIDNLIQTKQLVINNYNDIVFEWIPYNQFESIKEIGKGGFATVFSAIWKDGPLFYNINANKFIRNPNEKIALKCLHRSQNITEKFLKEVWYLFTYLNTF